MYMVIDIYNFHLIDMEISVSNIGLYSQSYECELPGAHANNTVQIACDTAMAWHISKLVCPYKCRMSGAIQ